MRSAVLSMGALSPTMSELPTKDSAAWTADFQDIQDTTSSFLPSERAHLISTLHLMAATEPTHVVD